MKFLVSEEDIAKHYAGDGIGRYQSFSGYQALGEYKQLSARIDQKIRQEFATIFDASPWTVERWCSGNRGSAPRCVQGVEFLKKRRLVPLRTDSETLGLVTYLAGLNWHAGSISIPKSGQPAYVPEFKIAMPLHLDEIAQALNLKFRHSEKYKRYTLESYITLLLAELGLPTNGTKNRFERAYPRFIDVLLQEHLDDHVALFLGTQVLTKAEAKDTARYLVYNTPKCDEAMARRTSAHVYELYQRVFPGVRIAPPVQVPNQRRGPNATALQLETADYGDIVKQTHDCVMRNLAQFMPVEKFPLRAEHQLKELPAS